MSAVGPTPLGFSGVMNIAHGQPFVDALARGILQRLAGPLSKDPAALADVTVLLPTRRACRSLREAFLRATASAEQSAVLLPRLLPLGDMDEEELLLAGAFTNELGQSFQLPQSVPGLERQFLLARQIIARDREGENTTPDQAVRLAQELARLLDQIHTERLDPALLHALEDNAQDWSFHWQETLKFLSIVTEHWPNVLNALGALDPASRRGKVLEAQADFWRESPPVHPVIAAGSTGTVPATADLLSVIKDLPQGCVVLPGMDTHMDDVTWQSLPPSHPQYGLARLLEGFGLERDGVADWQGPTAATCGSARTHFISRALLPAEATATWRDGQDLDAKAVLAGVTRLDADTEQIEATAIALIMRETLETPSKTAALVTPDRMLARRVSAALRRYGVQVDDSAGTPLDKTTPGVFLRLSARLCADGFAPVALLAALKHPLSGLGLAPVQLRTRVRALERAVLRGPRPGDGVAGLRQAITAAVRAQPENLVALIDALESAAKPFVDALGAVSISPAAVLRAHVAFTEALAQTDADSGPARLWAGEAGEALAGFVAEWGESAETLGDIRGRDYPALLDALMAGQVVRPQYGAHPRLNIWGPLEARLQNADVMILSGLNEETWPAAVETGPWMSRPMMQRFGLPLPERRIGLSAHDFVQAMGAAEVYLTRARRAGGAPTVPSRWLVRMETLLKGLGDGVSMASGVDWTHWAQTLDEPTLDAWPNPVAAPRPTPPVAARPTKLSVTQVETWIRDPYATYARHVLKLTPLDPLDADPGAADRGTVIHDVLEAFVKAYPKDLPENALAELLRLGRITFAQKMAWPQVRAFWWPRFERIAEWFIDYETSRRAKGFWPMTVEVAGNHAIAFPGGTFTLTARADRLDRTPTGGVSIIDYKTGRVPSEKQVDSGLSPQLPLEAAMVAAGSFDDVAPDTVDDLTYVKVSGGRVAGKETRLGLDATEIGQEALDGLERKVRVFALPNTPYPSRVRAEREAWAGDYDHLARRKEWTSSGGEGGDS